MSRADNKRSKSLSNVAFLVLIINQLASEPTLVLAGKDKGDDIILAKGKIILRGGKGKGNIILDPGHSSDGGHHEMPSMMPMMGHFNPYAFYPMQHHHQPQMMIRPIYIEDHSQMQHQHQQEQHHHEIPQHHHMEEHHDQHQYHHEEPQHHYEPQHHEVEQHHEEHHEQPHNSYEHSGGDEHHQQHDGYEHPMMSLLSMHGSGPRPIYQPQHQSQQQQLQSQQQMLIQAYQQPAMYAQLSPAAYQQAQYAAAEQEAAMRQQQQQQLQQHNELQQGQSSEVSSQSPAQGSNSTPSSGSNAPTKATNPVTALLEKSANNPLIKRIKPLFKRNKESKDSSQKKP